MVFQDPMTSFNPVYRIGDQIAEAIQVHSDLSKEAAQEKAAQMLSSVGIPHAEERARDYPHSSRAGCASGR